MALSWAVCVPTLNAGQAWKDWIASLSGALPCGVRTLVIDSSSNDQTVAIATNAGLEVITIDRDEFSHGRTRQLGVELLFGNDLIVFLTQDALIASPEAIGNLLRMFEDERVGVAYGRQLPHASAGALGAHARLFNYPARSAVRAISDSPRLGIKTAFISNSFAAYRREALMAVGGFPADVIFGEDSVVTARMLLAGWKVAYCAEAAVHHSHDYSFRQEFRRYFDIGVLHDREKWLLEKFGKPLGEGKRFVLSEFCYLVRYAPWLVPSAILRTGLKYLGYRLGLAHGRLPLKWRRRFSMNRKYWDHPPA